MDPRQAVALTLNRYADAYRTADAAGCAACFLPEGTLHSAFAPPALGRAAIEALHRDWVTEGGGEKTLEIVEFGASGGMAWCLARFAEGAEAGEGWSLCVLELQADGDWLIRACSLTAAD